MQSTLRTIGILGCFVATLVVAALLWLQAHASAADSVTVGGHFELVDHNGAIRTADNFRGSYMLIFFGFTHCPDLCPTSLKKMSNALDELAADAPAKAARIAPLFITVDPERDTVSVLKDYVTHFHPRLVGLTGAPEQIDRVAKDYGVFYAPVPVDGGDYLMDHSGFVLLMGPAGEYLTHFESDMAVGELVEELEQRLKD